MGQLADIRTKLLANSHVRNLLHSFKNDESLQLDLDALIDEIVNAHAARPVKTMTLKRASEKELNNANIADQRTRSRLVEILGRVNGVASQLNAQLNLTREVLYLRYPRAFDDYRHRTDKERVTNVLLFQELIMYLSALEALAARIIVILEDIDKAGFMLQRQVTIFVHSSQRRNTERSLRG